MADINGGSAFPDWPASVLKADPRTGFHRSELEARPGMSLRDYFAGQALTVLVVELMEARKYPGDRPKSKGVMSQSYDAHVRPDQEEDVFDGIAWTAYKVADAMLKERVSQ